MTPRIFVVIFLLGLAVIAVADDAPAQQAAPDYSTATTIEGHYIPKDLDDCFATLEKELDRKDVRKLKNGTESDLIGYHSSFGMGLRNQWGLWRGSRLAKYFNGLGIFHPDDMSDIILYSFWRHLHQKPLELDKQIASYQEYWKQAREKMKQGEIRERERAGRAARELPGMMLGWTLEASKLPPATVPQRQWVIDEVRARFLAPFRGGAFLAARGKPLSHTEDWADAWTTVGYFLDPQDEKLHRIVVPEIHEITSALAIGEVAWFAGKTKGKPLLAKVDGPRRRIVPLPPGQKEPPELGLADRALLLVYPHAVFREQAAGGWEILYTGPLTLRHSGPPPRLFGNRLYLRDEGRGENDKLLSWLDLSPQPHLGELHDEVDILVPMPTTNNTSSYCVTPAGDLWATLGEDSTRKSLLRRTRDGNYQVGILDGSLQYENEKPNDGPLFFNEDVPPDVLDISGLFAQGDQLMLVGNHGLYQLADRTLVQVVAFANTTQDIPTPEWKGKKFNFHWQWHPNDLIPLGKDKWLLSETFSGIYLLELKPGQGYEFRSVDDPLGKDIVF